MRTFVNVVLAELWDDGDTEGAIDPSGLLPIARKALADFAPTTANDVNAIGRMLTLMVEPRLTGERWYLFADPAAMPCFEMAVLSSAPAPQMEPRRLGRLGRRVQDDLRFRPRRDRLARRLHERRR